MGVGGKCNKFLINAFFAVKKALLACQVNGKRMEDKNEKNEKKQNIVNVISCKGFFTMLTFDF